MTIDKDILVSRVVDGVAGPQDWTRLEQLAVSDSSVWRELALAQRDHQLLIEAMAPALASAEGCELPSAEAIAHQFRPSVEASPARRWGRVVSWGGWAIAAGLALAFAQHARQPNPTLVGESQANLGSFLNAPISTLKEKLTADEAFDLYRARGFEEGRYVTELPTRRLLDSALREDGQYDVLYVRQIVERGVVPNLYRMSNDELGNPTPVPAGALPRAREAKPARGTPMVFAPTDSDGWRIELMGGA